MEKLTNKQLNFANYYVYGHPSRESEVLSGRECAILAGYSERSSYEAASELLRNPKVSAYIDQLNKEKFEIQKRRFTKLADVAQSALYEVAEKGRGMARVMAANSLLDRSGHKPADRVIADVTNHDAIKDETTKEKQQQAIIDAAEAISGSIIPISRSGS